MRDSRRILRGLDGYEVTAVANGQQALDAVAEGQCNPDIILSALHLPADETGEQVVQRVRGILGRSVPALLLTGSDRK